MKIVYYFMEKGEGPSIFLAGASPRDPSVLSWRPEALKMLQNHGFKGNVFVPEYEIVDDAVDYGDEHIDWEHKCLKEADLILFWVPRNLKNMHGLTTNIEWGRWESSGKVLLGYPDHAERMGYMKYYAKKHQVPIFHDLAEMLEHASDMVTQKKG